jgi:hypothetical protein
MNGITGMLNNMNRLVFFNNFLFTIILNLSGINTLFAKTNFKNKK